MTKISSMLRAWLDSRGDFKRLVAEAEANSPPPPHLILYPGWRFCIEEANPSSDLITRRALWQEFAILGVRRTVRARWYKQLTLNLRLGNDLSRCVYVCGSFEPNEFYFLQTHLQPGMTFIDAGANEGLYSLFASRCIGSEGCVIAVEPSERELAILRRNLEINNCANVRIAAVALSDCAGEAFLKVADAEHAGQNTLGNFAYPQDANSAQLVTLEPLDRLVDRLKITRVDFVKLDIEGAETRALRGARGTLRSHMPTLLIEVLEPALQSQGSSWAELVDELFSLGYRVKVFSDATGLLEDWGSDKPLSANIVAVPA